ncbi:MAG TPA: oligosaccharide flippase family protein [Anaerolineales bacterium]|nr:oligosaccharide flippase family protein [Anaerolineales bacterium]
MSESPTSKFSQLFNRLFGNELIQRVVKNSGYLFSATGVAAVLSMVQSIFVVRLLGVTDFGVLGTITLFTSVVNKFASFRMSELVIKYVGQYSVEGDETKAAAVFKSAGILETLTSFFAFGLIWLLAPLGAQYFAKDIATTNWFILYGLIVLANFMIESSTGLLQIFDRYKIIAGITVGQSILTLGLVGLVFINQGGLFEIVLVYMVGKITAAIALAVSALVLATQSWGFNWWRAPVGLLRDRSKELVKFAVSTNISATINLVNKDGELLWVSALTGPTGAGYYKLALSLANLIQLPVSPLPQATYPELSREVAAKNWGNMRYVLRQGSFMAFAYSILAGLFLVIFGRPLIAFFYTPEFLPSYPALLILMVGLLIADTFYWNRIALLSLGLPDYPAKINSIAAVLKVIGILIIVPIFGYLGSAALLSGFYVFSVSLNVRKTFHELKSRASEIR